MKSALPLLVSLILAAPASAVEWTPLGARAVGMGGVGVAVPQGPADAYWNPANLGAADSKTGFQLPVTGHFALTGSMLEGANDLDELSKRPAASITQSEINAALAKLGDRGNGARADLGGILGLKLGRWAFFTGGFGYMGAVPQADLVKTTPNQIANDQNDSKLIVKGATVLEFGVGHGRELPFAPGLFLGGNLKVLSANVGYADAFILRQNQGYSDLFDRLQSGAKRSANFGVDAGALWDLERSFGGLPLRPRLGVTGRNLNNPTFKQPDSAVAAGYSDKWALNPQLRLGASISPFDFWRIGTDFDMTRNLTPIDGVASRQWGVGTEINLVNREAFNVPLRAGFARNIADGRSGTMLTFGAGLNLAHFHIDASAALSPKKVRTQSVGASEEFPREAVLGVSLGVLFGGTREAPDRRPSRSAAPEAAAPGPVPPPQKPSMEAVPTERVKQEMEKAQQELDKEAEQKR